MQKAFLQDVKSLKATIDELGNPFRETSRDLLVLDTRDLADQSAVETLYKLADTGTKQYHNFVQDRLVDKKKPLDDTTKKNKVHLFSSPKGKGKSKTQELLSAVQSDSNLFFRLYIAFQVRDGNLQEFFSHENHRCPPSLSDREKLRWVQNQTL